jgi:hypothetical protein
MRFLAKPIRTHDLARHVRAILDGREAEPASPRELGA